MSRMALKLEGYRPWSDREETTCVNVILDDNITKEEFLYKLQEMFVAMYEQENPMCDSSLKDGYE